MQLWHALIVKRYFAADKNVEHNAKAPHVNLRASILLRLQEFWGCKVETAAERLEEVSRAKQVRKSKVDDLDITSLTDEYVLDLQVSMHNAIAVTVVQSAGDLAAEFPGLLFLEPAVADNVVQHLTTVDILEQHVPVVIRSHDVAHATDVGMVGKGHNGSLSRCADFLAVICPFALGSRTVLPIGRPARHDLDSNLFSGLLVPSKFHLSHAASSNRLAKLPVARLGVYCCSPPHVLGVRRSAIVG